MLNRLSFKTLIIILTLLIGAIILIYFLDKKTGERTFKKEIAQIDTSAVTAISVFPQSDNHKEVKLSKRGKVWKAERGNIIAEADNNSIQNLLINFSTLTAERLAAKDKSKWKNFSVDDSSGTRVKFFAGENVLLDIMVGRFSFNNVSRQGFSYIRLYDSDEVYAVEGFLPMDVNQPFNQWRNKIITKFDKNNLTKITFSYPSDSGFVLLKDGARWRIDTLSADSAKTDQFLNDIAYVSSTSFCDNFIETTPQMTLVIEGSNMPAVTLKAFPSDTIKKFILHSSLNSQAYFEAGDEKIHERFFKARSNFIPLRTENKNAQKKKK